MMEEIDTNKDVERIKNEEDVIDKILETKENQINEEKLSKETIKLDDDEGDLCRICRTASEIESPLYYPCACSGSIKYVHQECLLQWLSRSNARQCEVCKHPFAFSPIYASNAPIRLSFKELILGVALKAGQSAKFCIRLLLVLSVWFLFVPFTTYWMWRFTFVRNFVEAQRLFMSRCTPSLFLMDCLQGLLLSACIIFVFLGTTSIREYFCHIRELNANHNEPRPHGNIRLPPIHGGVFIMNEPPPDIGANNFNDLVDDNVNEEQRLAFEGDNILRLNAENVTVQLEIQAPQLEARVEQILDAPDDVDIGEDVSFDVLVGMEGPIYNLVENVIIVLASNAIFLGLVAFIPLILGRLVLSIASKIITATNNASALATSVLIDYSSNSEFNINMTDLETKDIISQKPNNFDIKVERIIRNDTFYNMIIAPIINVATYIGHITEAENTFNKMTGTMVFELEMSDATTIAIGYAVLFTALSFYLGLIAFIRYTHGEPTTIGYMHGVNGTPMVAIAPSMVQQIVGGIQYVGIIIKVVILMVIELGLFPILCGWWLDICTMEMFNITILQRISFFWTSPITITIIHWLIGIVHMLQIGIIVSLIHQVLRPEILYFLRDPTNPNYNPFRDLVHDSLYKQVQRIFLSIAMYGSFIAMLIYVPAQIAISMAPLMFPLNNRISDPFTENPADLLLFHLCIPFAVEHFKPQAIIKKAIKKWFFLIGWMLGLSQIFILEQESHTHRYENYQRRPLRERIAYLEVVQNPLLLPVDIIAQINDNFQGSMPSNNDNTSNNGNEHTIIVEERWCEQFALRIGLLVTATWTSLLVINTTTILLPITIGRTIFASILQLPIIHGAKFNDIYAFNIGCYILWSITTTIRYMIYYLQTHDFVVFVQHLFKWMTIGAKSMVLLFLWIVLIPMLIGLIFELVALAPLRVPANESPILFLYHDWALGLITLQIWTKLVMLGYRLPFTDDSWRLKFEQVRTDGYSHLQGQWIFKEIIFPILIRLITTLCIPYVIVHTLLPLFGYNSWFVDYAVDQFAWSGCLFLILFWYGTNRLQRWYIDLHNAIRDDRYLIGRRLHNFVDRRSKMLKQPILNTFIIFPEETTSVALQDARPPISGITSIECGLKDAPIEPKVTFVVEPLLTLINVVSKNEDSVGSTSKKLEVEGEQCVESNVETLEIEGEQGARDASKNLVVEGAGNTSNFLEVEGEQDLWSIIKTLEVEGEQGIEKTSKIIKVEGEQDLEKTSKTIEVEAEVVEPSHCLVKEGVGIVLEDPKEGYCSLHEENEPLRAIVHSLSVPKAHDIVNSKSE